MELDLVLPTTFDMDVPTYPLPYAPPTHHVQSSPTFHHHTHTHTPSNTELNPIEVSDDDCEGKCEERHNLDERGDSPHMWVEYSFVEGTLKFGKKDVLRLKKVAITNIMSPQLTLIVFCFLSSKIILWHSFGILGCILITIAIGMQFYEKQHFAYFN